MAIQRIRAGKITHTYFGGGNPEISRVHGKDSVEVDFTIGADMLDCFERREPIAIDGVEYYIAAVQHQPAGLSAIFVLEEVEG